MSHWHEPLGDESTAKGDGVVEIREPDAAVDTAQPSTTRSRRGRPSSWQLVIGVFLLYLIASVVLFARSWRDPFTSVMGKSDGSLFVWWLEWIPWSMVEGRNPLLTDYLNYPDGVNATWNTSIATLGLITSPLTFALGPILASNVLTTLAPVASGMAFFLVVRRYVDPQWPAVVGGLLFAFAPYQLAHGHGHTNLSWSILPPLLLLFIDEIFVRQRVRPWLLGSLFGLVFVVQTGVSTEMLAIGAVMFCITAFLLAICWRHEIRNRWRYVAISGLAAGAVYLLFCSYFLYVMLFERGIPKGAIRSPGYWVGDAANLLVPSFVHVFRLGTDDLTLRAHAAEQGLYLGPFLLLLIVFAVICVRRPIARLTGVVGLMAFLACLGPRLVVFNDDTDILLPWRVVGELPLFEHILTVRFSLYTGFCAALLLVFWLDWLADPARNRRLMYAGGGLAFASLISLLPSFTMVPDKIPMPDFFRNGSIENYVSEGDVVKTIPRGSTEAVMGGYAMAWQASNDMYYRTQGGYFIGGDEGHPTLLEGVPDAFDTVADGIWQNRPIGQPAGDEYERAREALKRNNIRAIVLVPLPGHNNQGLIDWTQQVTGVKSQRVEGVELFLLPR